MREEQRLKGIHNYILTYLFDLMRKTYRNRKQRTPGSYRSCHCNQKGENVPLNGDNGDQNKLEWYPSSVTGFWNIFVIWLKLSFKIQTRHCKNHRNSLSNSSIKRKTALAMRCKEVINVQRRLHHKKVSLLQQLCKAHACFKPFVVRYHITRSDTPRQSLSPHLLLLDTCLHTSVVLLTPLFIHVQSTYTQGNPLNTKVWSNFGFRFFLWTLVSYLGFLSGRRQTLTKGSVSPVDQSVGGRSQHSIT